MIPADPYRNLGPAATHESVEVRDSMGLLEPESLEERIRRAQHDPPLSKPLNALGGRSHCWLCRRAWEQERP